ncbi:MAG TPA: methionine synthase [Mycobacteriales bacterium]
MTAWPVGAATGIGSLPGTDAALAQARTFELLPDLPHLVELPGRGPGADLVGRGAVLLTDLPVDLQPAGWRLVSRAGRDLRRSRDLLARDLDVLAGVADGYEGPLKIQAAGPWTLAASLELPRGDRALADHGAVADVAAALADGLAQHVDTVARLVPGAEVLVQLDEPSLPAVLAGRLRTASGFAGLRTPETSEAQAILSVVLSAVERPGVHCCAPAVPVGLLRAAGAAWVSLDATRRQDEDQIGEAYEAGTTLLLGVDGDVGPARDLLRRLGLSPAVTRAQTVLTPTCGLGGERLDADPWPVYRRTVQVARAFADELAEAL